MQATELYNLFQTDCEPRGVLLDDIETLFQRAEAGETIAQRDLAFRLHEGIGVAQDFSAAAFWLRRAATGGDAWAQTTLAITLRKSRHPEEEAEAVYWLKSAAAQGDTRAVFNLGLQEFHGIGMPKNVANGISNVLRASMSGNEDARSFFDELRSHSLESEIEICNNTIEWPILSILLGPNPAGHLSGIFDLTDSERLGGEKYDELMKYEGKNAKILFEKDSLLKIAYKQHVNSNKYRITQSIIGGEYATTISFSGRDITLADGAPAYWRPSSEDMNQLIGVLQAITMRTWIRWVWTNL
jgi:hypothetical protein